MAKNLVIVESPAKAKTIEKYLGDDFTVASSYGHVRDLPKGDNAIDKENNFKPTYEISKDKLSIIKTLKSLVKKAELIYLASDDDREGEAISWHLKEALDLDDASTRRIVFREITKNAILNAIQNPRGIDLDLVNAQQARRVLDRLVGFELSPILWKKIKTGLSAGRVQSVAVRLVVERERDIEKFTPKVSYKVVAEFDLDNGKVLQAELGKKFNSEEEAAAFLDLCIGAEFSIQNLETKPSKRSPAPPFTTSTLQQEASRKLGFSVAQTMTLAQRLYESGHISYMRTDSVNLSQEAIKGASNQIVGNYGQEYLQNRVFKTKSQSAQEAHEAIRPTDFTASTRGSDRNEQRLYELIWKRAIASQMADAQLEKTIATIDISTSDQNLTAQGEVVKFDGFLKVYMESTDEDEENGEGKGMLPPLSIGQSLNLKLMRSRQGFSRPSARYTEASLVKKLEEMGIGRPSTYAPTISTIQKRDYVVKENREGREREYISLVLEDSQVKRSMKTEVTGTEKNKLFPTNTAMIVNDFLVEHFENIVDYSFTARVEKQFDEIARGGKEWDQMIENFYGDFHPMIEKTESLERSDVGSSRQLGTEPQTGKPVVAKLGKFGAYVQIGENPSDEEEREKPKYASLRQGQLIESITLEEALELFKLPREVGTFEEEVMIAAIGKFGPYVKHQNKFVSIPKDEDPLSITEARAIELIKEKRQLDAERYIKTFPENEDIMVLNGRYGPYIKAGKKNVKIPKDKVPEELTLEECLELAEKAPERKGRGRRK
ncbi:MAG: type I DNA topoisomerase [Cyclobacteriaceae bacterium]|nr:type I DNA topoisomerase [Cyclobacteriaceae bacterium]